MKDDSLKQEDEAWRGFVRKAARTLYGALIVPAIIFVTLFLWLWA